MQKFSRYKKDIIAHYHKDKSKSLLMTINKFNITYKELYKIIDTSRIFNYMLIDGEKTKKCSSCGDFKSYNESCYYKRKNTDYYYSACKFCMKQLSRTYKIINKKKIYDGRIEYYRTYYYNNNNIIKINRKRYYITNRNRILEDRKETYTKQKRKFLREFLFKLQK